MKNIAKRFFSILLILAMVSAFAGCGAADKSCVLVPNTPEKAPVQSPFSDVTPTSVPRHFPKDFTLFGAKIGNMDAKDAAAVLEKALHKYSLTIVLNNKRNTIPGNQLSLSVSEKNLARYLDAVVNKDNSVKLSDFEIVRFNKGALGLALREIPGVNSTAKNAYLTYNASKSRFVLKKEQIGYGVDMDKLYASAVEAIQSLETSLAEEIEAEEIIPGVSADSKTAQDALNKANSILDLKLKYVYSPATGKSATETLTGSSLAKLLVVGSDGLTVMPNDDALVSYAADMKNAHSVVGKKALFKTSNGGSLDLGNSYSSGEYVDTDALIKDISNCIKNNVSGTRTVAYKTVTIDELTGNFGGNYVEVDLTNQHMWVYRNGQCVVSCGTVSGCPADGHATPTGLYYINDLATNCHLVGVDYDVAVSYWAGFNGNIGLHDASWHSTFGGNIYYYKGSHGCVNLPLSGAAGMYNNVSLGTPVIVYGGKTTVPPLKMNGTSSYTVTNGCAPFTLDAKTDYDLPLSYSSDNSAVATVNKSGLVTVLGPGTAHITVATQKYAWCKLVVTITVEKTACELGQHPWDDGKVIKSATCEHTGEIFYTCTVCGATKTESIPLADHIWDAGVETVAATCEHEGEMKYTCTVCKTAKTVVLPIVDHAYDDGICIWCKRPENEEEK